MTKSSVALSVKDMPVNPVVKAKAAKPAATKEPAAKPVSVGWSDKYRVGTIGRDIADAIMAGKFTNQQILEDIKKSHAGAKTTYGCIAWYRSAGRKAGAIK